MYTPIRNKLLLVLALTTVLGGEAYAQYKVLPVPLFGQQTNMWCWAATTQMTAQYSAVPVQQCIQANTQFGRSDCCTNPWACVFGGWPQYSNWGFNAATTAWGVALTWQQFKGEIDANRPVNFSWGWTGGGGHIMVANGYYDTGAVKYVLVNDPWPPGAGTQKWITYDEYVQAADHTHWRDYYSIVRVQ